MKITPQISSISAALESRALSVGWKQISVEMAGKYHAGGGGNVLPVPNSEAAILNAIQRVKRIFRGHDGPKYYQQAEALREAALASLPIETRAGLERPGDPVYLAALAAKESIEAVNAVHLGASPSVVLKEINDAIAAFSNIRDAIEEGKWRHSPTCSCI